MDGHDVPDFVPDKSPDYRPTGNESGLAGIPGDAPFILHEDGLGWLHVPKGLQDGPMPTHYEPLESPVKNTLYSRDTNPVVNWFTRHENRFAPPGDPRFPFRPDDLSVDRAPHRRRDVPLFESPGGIATGIFAEILPRACDSLKVKNGDFISIVSLRGANRAHWLADVFGRSV